MNVCLAMPNAHQCAKGRNTFSAITSTGTDPVFTHCIVSEAADPPNDSLHHSWLQINSVCWIIKLFTEAPNQN